MLGFGGSVTSAGLIMSGAVNIDKVLVGEYLGATALGIYGRAYQLVNLPSEQLVHAIGAVAMPALSRLQADPGGLHRAFLRMYSVTLATIVPVTMMCGVFAEEIVRIMFGPKWGDATPVVQLLAPTILASGLISPLGWLLLSSGQYRKSLIMTAVLAPMMVLGVTLGLRAGMIGVAAGLSVAMVAATVPLILWTRAGSGMPVRDLWLAIRAPLLSGLAAATVSYVARMYMGGDLAVIWRLSFGLLASFSAYLLVLLVVFRQADVYRGLIRQLRGTAGGNMSTS
jgi:PST family polysaccharide transporter